MTSAAHSAPINGLDRLSHHARRVFPVTAIIAAGLTSQHQRGFPYLIGATGAWLLTVFFAACQFGHRWDTCPCCDWPPTAFSTPANRLEVARRVHPSQGRRWFPRLLYSIVLLSIVFPKPYLHPWWGQLAAAGFYAFAAVHAVWRASELAIHEELYKDECPNDKCRAGLETPAPQWSMWLGHYGLRILAGLIPATCAIGVVALVWGGPFSAMYSGADLLLLITIMNTAFAHKSNPCVRCAANMPSSGEELAERRMGWLRAYHVYGNWFLGAMAFFWALSWGVPRTIEGRIFYAVAAVWLGSWALLTRIHGRVKPWCPWCRDEDEDDLREDAPDPTTNEPQPV